MSYLLDTHIVLWVAENAARLTPSIKKVLTESDSEKYVSIVSAWEIEIKLATNKLQLEGGIDEFFKIIETNGFGLLGIEKDYIRQLTKLPLLHNDPFDRMLIATTLAEHMTLVTVDKNIQRYNVPCIC